MTLFKRSNEKLEPIKEISFDLEDKIKKITEKNLKNIFKLQFVKTEFQVGKFRIDTLAFDEESSSFVIIEYKNGRDSGLFDQGLSYIGIMLDRGADFITEYNEQLNKNLKKKEVDWSQSKIIFVAPSFNKNQIQAASLDLHIELWEFHIYKNDVVQFLPINSDAKNLKKVFKTGQMNKIISKIKTYSEEYHFEKKASKKTKKIYKEIKKRVMIFGNNVDIIYKKEYIAFRTNYHFAYIILKRKMIHVDLAMKEKETQDPKHLVRNMEEIGHYGYGKSRITIDNESQIPYVIGLLEQSYSKSLK